LSISGSPPPRFLLVHPVDVFCLIILNITNKLTSYHSLKTQILKNNESRLYYCICRQLFSIQLIPDSHADLFHHVGFLDIGAGSQLP
jgi:hypothetical protein